MNISIIVFAVIYKETTLGLALGVLAGGVLQLAIQIPMLYKKGFRYSAALELHHPGIRQIGKLILPGYSVPVFINLTSLWIRYSVLWLISWARARFQPYILPTGFFNFL